jgi:tRNA pseudouridine38-40 synthase
LISAPRPARIALCVQYQGAPYCGWQRQRQAPSVQQTLEEAIRKLDSSDAIRATAAGRTDAGVHASGQVIHFDSTSPIPARTWAHALNGRLPETIRALESAPVPRSWHACHSAVFRRYRYLLFNGRRPNLFLAPFSWHRYRSRLDEAAMGRALGGLLGHHDFSAFQRSGSRRRHARTTIQEVQLERHGDLLEIEIQASGFLYGMVRLIMGQLVAIGERRLAETAFQERWRQRRRSEVKEAAPPHGLCLIRVGYRESPFGAAPCRDGQPHFRLAAQDPPPSP